MSIVVCTNMWVDMEIYTRHLTLERLTSRPLSLEGREAIVPSLYSVDFRTN